MRALVRQGAARRRDRLAGRPFALAAAARLLAGQRYGIDGAYLPFAVRPENLPAALRALPLLGLRGVNVTVPHKEAALGLCDRVSEAARRIGAVNTIVVGEDGALEGSNTDGFGFLEHLQGEPALLRAPDAGPAVLLGAGGAARAIAVALLDAGVPELRLVNRTGARGAALAAALGPRVRLVDWADRAAALEGAALLVNSTTLGMSGQPALDLDLAQLPRQAVVYDIVYVPLETPLLAAARARGNAAVDGLGMLLHQARPGFAAWFGASPRWTRRCAISCSRRDAAMIILGLTGSIGMGKSTAAREFRRLGIPVHDADAVHRLLGRGGAAVAAIAAAFPGVLKDGAIDRAALGRLVFADPAALKRLEAILHPLVRAAERRFLARARRQRRKLVVLDIPLLFETGGRGALRQGDGGERAPPDPARPGHGPAGHDRRAAGRRRGAPDARCREAPPRRYRHRDRPRAAPQPGPAAPGAEAPSRLRPPLTGILYNIQSRRLRQYQEVPWPSM